MKPRHDIFPGLDLPVVEYAKPEYITLPAYRTIRGVVVSRWRLSWVERLRILLTGDLWLSTLTFNTALQPNRLDTRPPVDLLDPERTT